MINNYSVQSIVDEYQIHKMSLRALSKKLHITDDKLKEVLISQNIKIKPRGAERALVNDDYFSEINSEDKAYFLGLLFADGCIVDTQAYQKSLTISLQERDSYILYKMKKYLNYQGNITFKKRKQLQHKDQETLNITSDKLCNDLINLGCTPKKSLTLEFPNGKIPDHLMRHFIRGLFDGDGSIASQKTYKKGGEISYHFRFDISGTYSICEGVKNVFIEHLSLKDRKIIKRKDHQVCVCAIMGKRNIQQIYHYLYDDATIFLTRKKEKMLGVFAS